MSEIDRPVHVCVCSSTSSEWIRRHENLGPYERVGYIGLGEQYNRWSYRLRAKRFVELARQWGPSPDSRVLDVGTGSAFYVRLYERMGVRDVRGVDLSPRAVELARATFPDYQFEVCDISQGLPEAWGDSGFDWLSAMDVLFHIVEDDLFRSALAACANAVRQGGFLLVSDNFPPCGLPADSSQAHRTLEDYVAVLRPHGFTLVDVRPVFFLSNGQVGNNGVAFHVMVVHWRTLTRVLGKVLRTWRPAGEALGYCLGAFLTVIDSLLAHQRRVVGFSTKMALFRRCEATQTAAASEARRTADLPP